MRPSRPSAGHAGPFRERLAGVVPWDRFDEAFGGFFKPLGRKAKPTRPMVGLHGLKHMHDLSDEEVVERWVENPYWQHFCGFAFFQHEPPIDACTMTRWRKRIGSEGMEAVLTGTVDAALQAGAAHTRRPAGCTSAPCKSWFARRSATESCCGRLHPAGRTGVPQGRSL